MKYIKRKSIASIPLEGKISDTLNVEDKVNNAPSINLVQQMTGIPVDGIIDFDGTEDEIPEGYEEVENTEKYSTEETFTGKYWINGKKIYRKVYEVGTLPTAKQIKQIPLNCPEMERVLDLYGYAYNPNTGSNYTFPIITNTPTTTSNLTAVPNVTKQIINLYSEITDYSIYTETYITLEYTKTTD